jgi:hypothetical protein
LDRSTRLFYPFFTCAIGAVLWAAPAHAWYGHRIVQEWMSPYVEKNVSLPKDLRWEAPLRSKPGESPRDAYFDLAGLLLLNPQAKIPSLSAKTAREVLEIAVDDPDAGMDRELPDSADPNDDRKYMGGSIGTPSAGFRHMYWSGWNWRKPIATFQIPARALGQSPDRIELFANEARARFRDGDHAWGMRLLAWTIHYLQDLTQPFHAVQLPTPRMVPWSVALAWPPAEGWRRLVREATRTITNYHWAYEGYVRHALEQGTASPFRECFAGSGASLLVANPRELALEITRQSIARSRRVGESAYALIGPGLKKSGAAIPLDSKEVDVADLLKNPTYATAREALNHETCESFRLATDATVWMLNWAFESK